jgi:hypothetical protein
LKSHRISRSSPRSSTESAAWKPEDRRPSGLPWAWRSFSRLAGGALAIILGLLLFGPAPGWLGGSYFSEEATYVATPRTLGVSALPGFFSSYVPWVP